MINEEVLWCKEGLEQLSRSELTGISEIDFLRADLSQDDEDLLLRNPQIRRIKVETDTAEGHAFRKRRPENSVPHLRAEPLYAMPIWREWIIH
jgi:hypothetical protein